MFAAIVSKNRLQLVRKTTPRLRPGWAVVRVRLAGICNTDLEILRGYHNFRGTLGHEFVGQVEDCADKKWLGQRVVGEINISCVSVRRGSRCAYCRRGLPTHCLRRRVLGIVGHDGAFAEYLTLPLANLHRVPDPVSDGQAVFTEPLAAACEILEQLPARVRCEAAVLGDGKLAQLIARVLRGSGLRVTLFGKHAEKLALARAAGISTVRVRPARSPEPREAKNRWPLVVEATGSPRGLEDALKMVAPRGTLVLKSTVHGAAKMETWPIVVHELTLLGSRCGPFPRALGLLRAGRVDPRPLISRVFPLRKAADAIRAARRPGVLKVLLRP